MSPMESWAYLVALLFAISVLSYGWMEHQERKRERAIQNEFDELDQNRRLDAAIRIGDRRHR